MAYGNGSSSHKGMHAGMTNRSPYCEDKSTNLPKGPSVNSEATRGGDAPDYPTPPGPREA